jgi:hypothetical protein
LGNVAYRVYNTGTTTQVGGDAITFDNGGFSLRIGSGNYDLQFLLDSGSHWVRSVTLAGQNVDLGEIAALPVTSNNGDYNGNGTVDAADYILWRNTLGQRNGPLPADGNANGVVDAADYGIWRSHFGQIGIDSAATATQVSIPAIPEPATRMLLSTAAAGLLVCGRRCQRKRRRFVKRDVHRLSVYRSAASTAVISVHVPRTRSR